MLQGINLTTIYRDKLMPTVFCCVIINRYLCKMLAHRNNMNDQINEKDGSARNSNDANQLSQFQSKIEIYNSELDLLDYGVYTPIFDYSTPEEYKTALIKLREKQKQLIAENKAVVCDIVWVVEGSTSKGQKMIELDKKLILRAFNGECSAILSKVKWNNVLRCKERIQDIFERINKLQVVKKIHITDDYLSTILEELDLEYGLELKTHQIKEQEQAIREERKEEERAIRELEQERARAEREEIHYQAALEKVKKEIESATGVKYEQLKEKLQFYEDELAEARANKERAISMAQQTRRGYVYVISNIGSFGEDIFKIGMTRRIFPEDRIRELSNASVPFKYDIHAMIYSEDAPSLESHLHNVFDRYKVNLINGKKEFFKVPLEQIEQEVAKCGISAAFLKVPEARDYRESLRIQNLSTNEVDC